jgi:hypothetical protein
VSVPPRSKSHLEYLTPDDRLRYVLTTDRGQVIDFLLQYETEVGGHFRPVVRYDTAHGALHRDTMDPQGRQLAKQPVSLGPGMSLHQALADAVADLRGSWSQYRAQFFRQLRRPSMDRNRMFDRNLTLSFDLASAIVDDPALLDEIPEGATVIFLPDDDPELATANRAIGLAALDRGEDVYFRHVHHAVPGMPATPSR